MQERAVSSFVPQDRLASLSAQSPLPPRAHGVVALVDVVGFTALTGVLVEELGEKRGAEELTSILDRVFTRLLEPVEAVGGSVIASAGDALLCWFDGDDGLRATAAALAMRDTIAAAVPELTPRLNVRAAVAAGEVERLLLGDRSVQVFEALAGPPVERLDVLVHATRPGEVAVDGEVHAALSADAEFGAWRDIGDGSRCAVVSRLLSAPVTVTAPQDHAIFPEDVRPWVPPVVFERLTSHQEGLVPFGDNPGRLSTYVAHVQSVVTRYGGVLAGVMTGDKGAYLHCAFGVPIAHGDDLLRAVSVAEELRAAPESEAVGGVRIGVATGTVFAAINGAPTRCWYTIFGSTVNTAARLMQNAPRGKVLLSGGFGASTARRFEIRPLPPQFLKGYEAPVPTSELIGPRKERVVHLPEPQYTVPLVGRRVELRRVLGAIRLAARGEGQVVGICGEGGMGKSRLLTEVIQLATASGFEVLIGTVDAFGTASPYVAWRSLWRSFFGLRADAPPEEQIAELEQYLGDVDLALAAQLPLLGPLLGLAIPENETTGAIPAQPRKKLVGAILLRCLADRAERQPLLLALEDCHWFDSVSRELLVDIRDQVAALPLLLVPTYRPPRPDESHVLGPELAASPNELVLGSFDDGDAAELIHLKLGELFGVAEDAPDELVRALVARANGNPFYLEELLNHLSDLGIDPGDASALESVELPASLQSLILDRVDRLPPEGQLVLRAAAVVGRRFDVNWLCGAYPELGSRAAVRASVDALARIDLIAHDHGESEDSYLFKHVATWEAIYRSLPFATREAWHEAAASYVERELGEAASVDLLAHHYGRSQNRAKELEYVTAAGEQAFAQGAYREAAEHLGRGLAIIDQLSDSPERAAQELSLQLGLGGVILTTRGQGAPEAKRCFDRALELTSGLAPRPQLVRALFGLWTYYLFCGEIQPANDLALQILAAAEQVGDRETLLQAHFAVSATVYWAGDLAGTIAHADEVDKLYEPERASLYVARYAQNPKVTAAADAAWAEWMIGRSDAAQQRCAETIALARELGHEFVLTIALQIRAFLCLHMGDVAGAAAAASEWAAVAARVGNPVYTGLATACLGWAKAASGEAGEGLGMLGAVHQGFLDQGVAVVDPLLSTALADAHLRCGRPDAGLELLERAIERAVARRQTVYLAEQHRLRGDLRLLAGGAPADAEDDYRNAISIAAKQGARAYELRAAISLVKCRRTGSAGSGGTREAETTLRAVRESISEGRGTPDIMAADALLGAGCSSTLEAPIR